MQAARSNGIVERPVTATGQAFLLPSPGLIVHRLGVVRDRAECQMSP
ncbi:hypothetical protein J2X55_002055 [Microbacterium sp. 1154]|nr:hypothetical protein [Microbacterium sp. 1154]